MPVNEFGQPVGDLVEWSPGPHLAPVTLTGRTCRLEPLGEEHVDGLFTALCTDSPSSIWTYMPNGPFPDREAFARYVDQLRSTDGLVALAVLLPDGSPAGITTYLRIDHANGSAEVGYLSYGVALQRTTAATEAMYLMARHAFDEIGVRRYEWKCNALNEASMNAATRLGFSFEGIFRKAAIVKGRNRDTAWFAITDEEWPGLRARFEAWLDPASFDEEGRQRARLEDLPRD